MLKYNSRCLLLITIFLFSSCSNGDAQKDWKLYKSKDNIQLWLKDLTGSGIKQFKIQTKIKQNIKNFYQLLRDVDKSPLWYDKVQEVRVLKKIDDNTAIYLLVYELPFPFKNRVTTLKGTINYDNKLQKIQANTTYFPYKIPEEYNTLTEVKVISGSWVIETMEDGWLVVTHAGYMDPAGNIPDWLVNQSYTSGPFKTLTNLLKLLSG